MDKVPYDTYDDNLPEANILAKAPVAQKPMQNPTLILDLDEIPLFLSGVEVMTSGTPCEFVYVILSGKMKVFVPQLNRPDMTLAIPGPGDPVGEMSVVNQAGRSATVITLEESLDPQALRDLQ